MNEEMKRNIMASNKENIGEMNIKDYLAQNKILKPLEEDVLGKRVGFFKVRNDGALIAHLRIPRSINKIEWYWFVVLDATEEEREKNIKLNYGD